MSRKKFIINCKGKKAKYVEFTAAEETARNAEEAVVAIQDAIDVKSKDRLDARKAQGWIDPWDLIEDILDRGVDAVKLDRDAIDLAYPKTR